MEVGGAVVLVSRVVDGSTVDGSTVVGASVVDSAVVLGSSEVVDGSALVEVDEAFVDEVVGAVEIWETWTVFVDVPEVADGEVAVGSPMLRVASPSESSSLLSEPPAMVKGFEDWKNPSESESSRSLMP